MRPAAILRGLSSSSSHMPVRKQPSPLHYPSSPSPLLLPSPLAPPPTPPPPDPNLAANRLFLDGKNTFFRRALPLPSIELSSQEGTKLFTESLLAGHAVGFFRLMEQLHTQNEPEYCGLASLVTVLNAMDIDPKRIWKGNWRFYSEELLSCCVPLTNVKREGIDFDQLANLAICNGMHVEAKRWHSGMKLEEFTLAIERASQTMQSCIILAYSRRLLGQTGDGHYSPMGAYHKPTNQVLILDCARFKYRPHWAPVPVVFEAMKALDADTQQPRGYLELSPAHVPPNSAILLKVLLRQQHQSSSVLVVDVEGVLRECFASSRRTSGEMLRALADALERVFAVEFSKHGGVMSHRSMEQRRQRMEHQVHQVKSWEDAGGEDMSSARRLQRIALVLSFLGVDSVWQKFPLHETDARREEIAQWIRPKGEELEVEMSFTKLQVAKLLSMQSSLSAAAASPAVVVRAGCGSGGGVGGGGRM